MVISVPGTLSFFFSLYINLYPSEYENYSMLKCLVGLILTIRKYFKTCHRIIMKKKEYVDEGS